MVHIDLGPFLKFKTQHLTFSSTTFPIQSIRMLGIIRKMGKFRWKSSFGMPISVSHKQALILIIIIMARPHTHLIILIKKRIVYHARVRSCSLYIFLLHALYTLFFTKMLLLYYFKLCVQKTCVCTTFVRAGFILLIITIV